MNVKQPPSLGSYPGGKSGSGIYQRLINLIPPHRVLVVPFAGHCGVVRNIRPAEQTIVIDRDPNVCEWWSNWRRSKHGRSIEIHNCDGIDWIRYRFGATEYSDAAASVATRCDASRSKESSEYFLFLDPPYVFSKRSTGRIYSHEMTDDDHCRLLEILTRLDAARYRALLCGYKSEIYSPLETWNSFEHRVPTRGGLQDEMIWTNYVPNAFLHDYQFAGSCRRERERIRRRQVSWREQLDSMSELERLAMLSFLTSSRKVLR